MRRKGYVGFMLICLFSLVFPQHIYDALNSVTLYFLPDEYYMNISSGNYGLSLGFNFSTDAQVLYQDENDLYICPGEVHINSDHRVSPGDYYDGYLPHVACVCSGSCDYLHCNGGEGSSINMILNNSVYDLLDQPSNPIILLVHKEEVLRILNNRVCSNYIPCSGHPEDVRPNGASNISFICGLYGDIFFNGVSQGISDLSNVNLDYNFYSEGDYVLDFYLDYMKCFYSVLSLTDPYNEDNSIYSPFRYCRSGPDCVDGKFQHNIGEHVEYTVHVRDPHPTLIYGGWLGDTELNPGQCVDGIIPLENGGTELSDPGILVTSLTTDSYANISVNSIDPNEQPTDLSQPISESNPILIPRGETVNVNVTVCLKESYPGGVPIQIYLKYTNATPICSLLDENLTINPGFTPSPDYVASPILSVSGPEDLPRFYSGETVRFDVRTCNIGSQDTSIPSHTRVSIYPLGITAGWEVNVPPLNAGDCDVEHGLTFRCPEDSPTTTLVHIITCADSDDVIDEDGHEDNNCNRTTIVCEPLVRDLSGGTECPDVPCVVGENLTLDFDTYVGPICVQNRSTTRIEVFGPGGFSDVVEYLVPALPNNDPTYIPPVPNLFSWSPPPGIPDDGYCVNMTPDMTPVHKRSMFGVEYWVGDVLDRWNPYTYEYSFTPPAEGEYRFVITVDVYNNISEWNETNNQLICTYDCVPPETPDLIPYCENVSAELGETITIYWGVGNIGGNSSGPFNTTLDVFTTHDTQYLGGLNAGESYPDLWSTSTICSLPGETSYVVTVDPENSVNELDETNNVVVCKIVCGFDMSCIEFV